MSTHANLSPSKRHRWGSCPGSIREEAKYPDDRSGPAAIDGTHTHTMLEFCLSGPWEPEELVDQIMQDDDGSFIVDIVPRPLKELAITLFGETDKIALLVGVGLRAAVAAAGVDSINNPANCSASGIGAARITDSSTALAILSNPASVELPRAGVLERNRKPRP